MASVSRKAMSCPAPVIIERGQGRVESLKARALGSVHRAKVT